MDYSISDSSIKQKETSFISKVFNWMFMGLATTAVIAFITSSNPTLIKMIFSNQIVFWGIFIAQVALVINLSANLNRMSYNSAVLSFLVYAALNGLTLSSIFFIYTASSIFSTFLVASLTFGAMALYGMTTKKDLSGIGSIAGMALLGLVIAQIVNIFLKSSGMASLLNYLGVLIFVALTAYDMQKIKQIGESNEYTDNMSIFGALKLYLDFINLFIYLLRIMGTRRD